MCYSKYCDPHVQMQATWEERKLFRMGKKPPKLGITYSRWWHARRRKPWWERTYAGDWFLQDGTIIGFRKSPFRQRGT